mmetsp:Transcript_64397/g.167316  ORF Transcript_64397/g.167316 Transcript_64397/m.167316 type:complete len:86 (+) Transcript_64397:552-809(+)
MRRARIESRTRKPSLDQLGRAGHYYFTRVSILFQCLYGDVALAVNLPRTRPHAIVRFWRRLRLFDAWHSIGICMYICAVLQPGGP